MRTPAKTSRTRRLVAGIAGTGMLVAVPLAALTGTASAATVNATPAATSTPTATLVDWDGGHGRNHGGSDNRDYSNPDFYEPQSPPADQLPPYAPAPAPTFLFPTGSA